MSLHLGVITAVIDDKRCILLSQRGDINRWTLPGGRLDPGERLEEAAAREVREETGVTVRIDRAVGLYYLDRWQRMNILYAGTPSGGKLQAKTRETHANRYFSAGSLPRNVLGASEALAGTRPQQVISSTRAHHWHMRVRFGWRWLMNRASGHPEPKFPVFNTRAVAVVWGGDGRRILTLPGLGYNPADTALGSRTLPRVDCDGTAPPWEALELLVQRAIGYRTALPWVGLWQNAERGLFEFVFAATISERELPSTAQWTTTRNAALSDRDMAYIERAKPGFASDPIWSLAARDVPNDLIYQEAKS